MRNLKTLREKAGLSQEQLAKLAGITQSMISQFETGHRKEYKVSTAQKISLGLGCGIEDLLGAGGQEEKEKGEEPAA